jgi:hypothetical protein
MTIARQLLSRKNFWIAVSASVSRIPVIDLDQALFGPPAIVLSGRRQFHYFAAHGSIPPVRGARLQGMGLACAPMALASVPSRRLMRLPIGDGSSVDFSTGKFNRMTAKAPLKFPDRETPMERVFADMPTAKRDSLVGNDRTRVGDQRGCLLTHHMHKGGLLRVAGWRRV